MLTLDWKNPDSFDPWYAFYLMRQGKLTPEDEAELTRILSVAKHNYVDIPRPGLRPFYIDPCCADCGTSLEIADYVHAERHLQLEQRFLEPGEEQDYPILDWDTWTCPTCYEHTGEAVIWQDIPKEIQTALEATLRASMEDCQAGNYSEMRTEEDGTIVWDKYVNHELVKKGVRWH